MVDIIPLISEKIKDLGVIELEFKKFDKSRPLIVLTEINNTSDLVVDGTEVINNIDIQIDVYYIDDLPIKVNEVTTEINKRLLAVGFIRKSSNLIKDENYIRRVSTFSANVSNNFKVYRKG